jgi:hypothetical protein
MPRFGRAHGLILASILLAACGQAEDPTGKPSPAAKPDAPEPTADGSSAAEPSTATAEGPEAKANAPAGAGTEPPLDDEPGDAIEGPQSTTVKTASGATLTVHPPYETPTKSAARPSMGGAPPMGGPKMTPRIVDRQVRMKIDSLPHHCSPAPRYDAQLEGSVLTLRARPPEGPLSRCVSSWNLRVTAEGLAPGEYRVELYVEAAEAEPRAVFPLTVP